jgi:hypothetical protein
MTPGSGSPFESIESAHEFVTLLNDIIIETKREIATDVQRQSNSNTRRSDALRVTLYSLEKLELHMNKTRRILNDLRSLRRLLFEERNSGAARPELKTVKVRGRVTPAAAPPAVEVTSRTSAAPAPGANGRATAVA